MRITRRLRRTATTLLMLGTIAAGTAGCLLAPIPDFDDDYRGRGGHHHGRRGHDHHHGGWRR